MVVIDCDHPHLKWEINPKTHIKTKRCVRCGRVAITLPPEEK